MGILSSIAIPSYLGQRRRARVIGDAQSNARVMAMALESRRAEVGTYGTAGTTVTWTAGVPDDATFLPTVALQNATQMNFSVLVTNGGVGYTLTVTDPNAGSATVLTIDQSGGLTLNPAYNK
jgi:type II secretory pathway pseudopilin PulG